MSTKDLINAIIDGNAIDIEDSFEAAMAEKISTKLDDMRQSVAAKMFADEDTES